MVGGKRILREGGKKNVRGRGPIEKKGNVAKNSRPGGKMVKKQDLSTWGKKNHEREKQITKY